ncbi:MAG: hypothetical protein ACFFCS_18115 [Candidatus Hodarchaeota archaeon]
MATPSAKPVVKDIVVNLLNPPRELMLGTKQYKLDFMVMNLRDEVKDLHIDFKTESFSLDQDVFEVKLNPKEKKNIQVTISPIKDGSLDLSMAVTEKKTIRYTEKVLESGGEEPPVDATQVSIAEETTAAPESQKPVPRIQPADAATTVKPSKPVKTPVKPVAKPVKTPVKPVTKPVKTPVKPVAKPVKTPVKPAAKPVKTPVKPSAEPNLSEKIATVKQQYLDLRTKLQNLSSQLGENAKGSPEYQEMYQEATKLKQEYERLGKLQKSQVKGADTSSGDATTSDANGVDQLKKLMDEYNILKAKLVGMDQGSPEYSHIKQRAMAIYKEYNEKRAKMVKKE